jgi:hypothetical protein
MNDEKESKKVVGEIGSKETGAKQTKEERIKEDVREIFTQFVKQEAGNRITQFNMMGLENVVMQVIDKPIMRHPGGPNDPIPPQGGKNSNDG